MPLPYPTRPKLFSAVALGTLVVTLLVGCEPPEVPADRAYRDLVMATIRSHLQGFGAVFSGTVDRAEDLRGHAVALHDLSHMVPGLFPAGSEGGKAKAAVWEQPAEFQQAAEQLQTATAALVAAVESKTEVGAAFKEVRGACKGCHDTFKE